MSTEPATPEPASAPPPARADARRNRDAVIAAALRVLADDPEASMREIADASGVTRTTVYRHFPSREELLRAILDLVAHEIDAAARAATAGDPGLEQVMRDVARSSIALGRRFGFLAGHEGVADTAAHTAGDDPMLRWMEVAQARGETRAELPPAWQLRTLHSLAGGAVEGVLAEQLTAAEAERLLAATLIAAFAAPSRG
jgi:AcrR family transcriptional regulator